jgi:serine/threonine-protein kinase
MSASVIDRAIERIADGEPVDWPALESSAGNDDERGVLDALRVLDGVAVLHRSTDDTASSVDETMEETADRPAGGRADERSDLWGRYRLVQKVGEGSFGSVYRAWDPELEREIAIKILHRRVASAELKRRLLREGRALAKIHHHNVVNVFAVESHKERVGLCMEFVRGQTLEAELRARLALTPQEAARAGEDVCSALAAVHDAGFVHRDVKARNVMREQNGRVVLMDFGTGREMEQLARGNRADTAGTPVYMAPEVYEGHSATPQSDVYSVGVLIYHLVTGEYPVEGRTMDELRDAHRGGVRTGLGERRADLPLKFIRIVERALAHDPRERYASAAALMEALGSFTGTRKRSRAVVLSHIGMWLGGITALLLYLGALNSLVFNFSLGRSEFATDNVWTWLRWGASSCLGPAVLLLIAFLAIGLVVVVRKLLVAVSGRVRNWDAAARDRIGVLARRVHMDNVTVLASVVLLLSGSALLAAWWHFAPLFEALSTPVTTASSEALRLFAPGPQGSLNEYKISYRKTFSWLLIVMTIAWFLVARIAARKRESVHWGIVAGAAAVLLLTLSTLDYPFRLLNYWGSQFDAVRWQENDCYIIGERRGDMLLFCSSLQPSHNRIVKDTDPSLERTGVHESIFTRER